MLIKRLKYLFCALLAGILLSSISGASILSSGQLDNPYKIAISNGSLYSVDTANNRIKKFDASGNVIAAFGSFGSGNDQFNQPQGIAADSSGSIYVVDTGNQRIQKLYDNGSSISFVKSITNIPELSDPNFLFPRSIRADDNGDIYIVDSAKNRVIKYSTGTVIGGSGSGGGISAMNVGAASTGVFNAPYGVDIDKDGYVYVADTENHKIKKYSSTGNLLLEYGGQGQGNGQFLYPCDVAVDPNKNVYVADTENHRVQKFNSTGRYLTSFGSLGNADGQFFAPRGVFVSQSGYLYVVGADNKIQKFDVSIHLENLRITEPIISPNGDSVKDVTDIKINLSEPALVSINIYDETGQLLIRKLIDSQSMVIGENVASWGGTGSDGKVVADGTYVIKITARTADGKKDAIPVKGNVAVDATPPTLSVLSPDIKLIKGPGTILGVNISFEVSENAETSIEISSSEDGIVYRGSNSISDISTGYQYFWNGKDLIGRQVKTRKQYSYKMTAKDAAGNSGTYFGLFITDALPPEIKNPTVSKPIFSPIMNYPTVISFEVSDNVFDPLFNLKIEIRNRDNNIIKIVRNSERVAAGNILAAWDGRNSAGEIVPDGIYQIAVSVEDGVGNRAEYFSEVETDTVPPIPTMSQNLFVFSPNGDKKFDSMDFLTGSNEKGEVFFKVSRAIPGESTEEAGRGEVFDFTISAEANKTIKLVWKEGSLEAFRQNGMTGAWEFSASTPTFVGTSAEGKRPADGKYSIVIFAEDLAGNISVPVSGETIVDTTPPTVLGLNADPNPFTPNDDGVKDTTKFWYKFSEPTYTTLSIYRDDGKLFRNHEGPTDNFTYPTIRVTDYALRVSTGDWTWEGRGSRNELLGGTYSWEVSAEDWVGNSTTSEIKAVVVDRVPTLIPYAFAEPDPFAPVNPNNSYTEIKYYLGRDNLKVKAWIVGAEGKTIKALVTDELQGKGEHIARWYGDFESAYDGPTASANKYRVADGSYVFKVWAEDPSEPATAGKPGAKPAESSNTVLVDNVPPNILVKGLAVDYRMNKAELTYSIPENSSVEVSVFDKDGMLLAAVITGESQTAGEHLISYPISGEGERYFKIIAEDRAKNIAEAKTDAFAARPDAFRLVSHQASPATFTPNGDGLTDLTRISYGLAGGVPDYAVGLDIRTPTGSTVKNLIANDPQGPGNYSFYWDGKDNAGNMALDGYYSYVLKAEDKLGAKVEEQGTVLLVSARPTVNISISSPIFSPNGDDAKDSVNFNYSVNYPTMYISGEALVKIEVLNSSSEAVWGKTFNHTAGSYVYEYNGLGNDGNSLPAGDYYARVSGQDALYGTAIPKTISLTVDYSQPEPTDFSIDPLYAKLGSDVGIKLSFPETLEAAPAVKLTLNNGAAKTANLTTVEGNSYEYHYLIIAEDAEGPVEVSVEARDLALNPISKIKTFVIDKTNPSVSDLSVSPNPASIPSVNGSTSIKFNVSEPLKEAPKVYVTQNGASPQLLVTSGQWQVANGQVEAKFDPISGYDGPALITVEVADLAGNESRTTNHDSLLIDTIKPVFSGIQSEISGNELPKYAKEGSEVTITFNSSEPLKFNPEVKVNEETATFSRRFPGLSEEAYEYTYIVSNTDINGNAALSISGFDFALNEGTAETSSSAESFVIDLVNPTVAIAAPGSLTDYIANPGDFSTNANPDETDRSRHTTMFYTLAERSKITVKIHKVDDDQQTYAKADFNDNNLIATLVNNVWQNAGKQDVVWRGTIESNALTYDLNNDGWADPGKYAFIVEGRDRAGNLTLKKWGGTVWVQDNVLTLKEPDQQDFKDANIIPTPEVNPDPHYISPNGNSVEPAQKRARFYFMIPLTLNPAVVQKPERIEAMKTDMPTKKVGKYSVKVYGDSGLTDLIRTVTFEADADSSTLIYEDWDGKNDANQFVPNGTYYMVVDVRDYAGNAAVDNLLKRSVVVDNTVPEVKNLSVSNYYFSAGKTQSTDPARQTTNISYEVGDNNATVYTTIGILRGGVQKIILQNTASQAATAKYNKLWSGEGYDIDGTYTYRITTVDQAGNMASAEGAAVLDKAAPVGTILINSDSTYTIAPSVTLNLTYSDAVSGMDKMSFSDDNLTWSAWEIPAVAESWSLPGADGTKYVYVRYSDKAGNYATNLNDSIILDTVDPYFSSGPTVTETPVNSWSTHTTPTFAFTAADVTSGVKEIHSYIDNVDQGVMSSYATSWHSPALSDGTHTITLRAYDKADRYHDQSYIFKIDVTNPSFTSILVDGAHSPAGTWTNHTSPYVTFSAVDSPSGVARYRGYINGEYWTDHDADPSNNGADNIITSPWHFTLSNGVSEYDVMLRAEDQAGNCVYSANYRIKIDTVAPALSQPANTTFNPYTAGGATVSFTSSDYTGVSIAAKIKYLSNTVKDLTVYNDLNSNFHITWDGTNNSNDYENEGDYTLEVVSTDGAGNSTAKTSTIYLRDDQRITNNAADSNSPSLGLDGSLALKWIEGDVNNPGYISTSISAFGMITTTQNSANFIIDYSQNVTFSGSAWLAKSSGITGGSATVYIKNSSGTTIFSKYLGQNFSTFARINVQFSENVNLGPGIYYISLVAAGSNALVENITDVSGAVSYFDRKYNQYTCSSSNLGQSWGSISGPNLVDYYSTGPTTTFEYLKDNIGDPIHEVWKSGNGIYYRRGIITGWVAKATPAVSWGQNVRITFDPAVSYNPSIRRDNSGNAYVAWQDIRNDNNEIYFQKVPFGFAPLKVGYVGATSVKPISSIVVAQSATLELPILTAPEKDKQNVSSIRPTFAWQHHKGETTEYKIDVAKNDTFTIANQSFAKSPNTGSPDSTDPALFNYTYSIHEFDPGLDKDTYYWKVTALATNEAATSEVWSFTIQPDLTLTGITNYPNPFSPNRETTKIRYKLGADADEVKIRIYDITGSLVTEFDGTTNGELSSIWSKYNDIEWDGRNGRGDLVMNGIYPYEVIARLGDKSLSGRGKIAVLK